MSDESQAIAARFTEAVATFAKTIGLCGQVEGRVFARLVLAQSPLTQDELMALLGCSRGHVSQAIRNLLEAGFVRKATQPGSRRVVYETHSDLWRITLGVWLLRMRRQIELLHDEFTDLQKVAATLRQNGQSAAERERAHHLLRHIERFERFAKTAQSLTQTVTRFVERDAKNLRD